MLFSPFLHIPQSSNTVILRITAVPLEHELVNNTGLEVSQGGAASITANNLAVQVNVAGQEAEIRYEVTAPPRYGQLQQFDAAAGWKPTSSFSQRHLDNGWLRYVNTHRGLQTPNVTDRFTCAIRTGSESAEEVDVVVAVRWIQFKVTRSKMEVNGVQSATVTPEDLHVIAKGTRLSEGDLHYRVVALPTKGRLSLLHGALAKNSTFSQKNVTDGLLRYQLLSKVQDDTRDIVGLRAFSRLASSPAFDFRVNIKPESSGAASAAAAVVNRGLSVLEGASKVINKEALFTLVPENREVRYSVMTSPRHGHIRKIHLSNSTSISDNVTTFTNEDIAEERLAYVHDDSETKHDSFTFQILVYKPHRPSGKKEGGDRHTFNVSVQLVNDQRPVRVVDRVFHVARDGQRLLTLTDLRYRDDDSDFDDSWLVYTRRGIPMGDLVQAGDPTRKLYEFTQRDLEQVGITAGRKRVVVSQEQKQCRK